MHGRKVAFIELSPKQKKILMEFKSGTHSMLHLKKSAYPDGFGELQPLTGLMYCADCGGKMYVHRTSNGKRTPQYTCSQYGKVPVGKLCPTQHCINAEVVLALVADMLKAIADYSKSDRAEDMAKGVYTL